MYVLEIVLCVDVIRECELVGAVERRQDDPMLTMQHDKPHWAALRSTLGQHEFKR